MATSTTFSPTETNLILQGIRWETYQALLQDLSKTSRKRLTYDREILEIMTPLPEHEINKRFLGRIVETATEVLGLEIYSWGSVTLMRKDLQRGIEPDECYYISREATMRGKLTLDLNHDPPPDLAIEVDITSSSLNRLDIYAKLGITEVWRFDGQNLLIYILQNEVYQQQEKSKVLSVLSRSEILQFLNQRREMGENALLKKFRQWLENKTNAGENV
ncbi:MAG: Uma2 family endonuclease [Halothece sp.]